MDFASLMQGQMAKLQKPPSNPTQDKKYTKRSEVEAAREAAYKAEQAAKETERIAKLEKKRKLDEEDAEKKVERDAKLQKLAEASKKERLEAEERDAREQRKRRGLPEISIESAPVEEETSRNGDETPETFSEESLISRLRELKEPIIFFGETHEDRSKRLHRLIKRKSRSSTPKSPAPTVYQGLIPTTLEVLPEEEMKVSKNLPAESDTEARLYLARQLASWFSLVLKEWAIALASRAESTKNSSTGQAAAASMSQAVDHLKPLYRKLENINKNKEDLPDDLLKPIAEIVHAAQERRYVHANDDYLKLSIGKAAWPIGVTMVGIHERSAREKLHESDQRKAHIMSDETTRKILQSIKRCLSFAQTRWPPTDVGQLMG